MEINIDKKNGIPIYIQVKNQIMSEIRNGNLRIGDKMPTERELSQRLGTSRNTISAAYNLLEQEGVLISYQGRGTFVAEEAGTWKQHSNRDKLLKIIDLGLDEALEMGLSPREFLAIAQERIKQKEEFMKRISAVYVECNIEQARVFAGELTRSTDLNVTPMVIADLINKNDKTRKVLEETQFIISTFNHVNQVVELTAGLGKEVLGVAISPCLETIVKIARYPAETQFGLICISKEFHFKVETALKSAGLDIKEIIATTSRNEEDVKAIVDASDVVIVSPGRYETVKRIAGSKKEVISFDYNLEQGSVNAIISKIVEGKNNI